MSPHTARILDFDGSVTSQIRVMERLGDQVEVMDLRAMGPSVRYLPSDSSAAEFDAAVSSREPRWLTFLGSGDFHHASASILKQFSEPFSLVVIDQHSDWIASSPCPCGGWLRDALQLPNLERIVSIGVGEQSIQGWKISLAPIRDILSGRIELYPSDCKLSRRLGRLKGSPARAKLRQRLFSTDIHWTTISDSGWESVVGQAVSTLPGSRVYLSIDKDCLRAEHAFTNWGNSGVTLEQLVWAIALIAGSKDLIGVDIAGEWSPIEVKNALLAKMALRIHPPIPDPTPADLARNEQTNLALLDALGMAE